jgi:hypothetical protein
MKRPSSRPMTFPICSSGSGENQKRAQKRGHSGLGLAVVAACTERLGATYRATLQNHLLRIEIR